MSEQTPSSGPMPTSGPTPPPIPELEELPTTPSLRPASLAVPTESVGPAAGSPDGRRRRWAIALVAAGLLVGATAVGAILLAGASDSTVARWAPADSLAYVEVRADLPGDQRAALGEFLSAFPGFADQASLERKLDELYDRLLSAATDGEQTYTGDIAPWFGGQLGFAVGPLPTIDSLDDPATLADEGRGLAIATVDDGAAAIGWVRATAEQAGTTVRTADADGTELLLLGPADHAAAAATSDGVLLLGDETSVRAAIARGGADGLATVDAYGEAVGALQGDQAAIAYVDMAAYVDWAMDLPQMGELGGVTDLEDLADRLPAWAAGGLRIEPDALVASGVMPHPADAAEVTDERSLLPDLVPATTAVLVDVHVLGASMADGLDQGGGTEAEQLREQLEAALAPLGGLEAIVGWMDEVGLVLLADDGTPRPGLLATTSDPEATADLARSVRNLATLAGLTTVDSEHSGTEITTIVVPPEALDGAEVFGEPVGIAFAVVDEKVVAIGTDALFVEAVIDAPSTGTLGDDTRFSELLARAGTSQLALTWVDLDAVEELVVAELAPADRAEFESEIRPYLAPLDALVGVIERDGAYDRTRGLLVLDEGQ